jgi:hypothetical protein
VHPVRHRNVILQTLRLRRQRRSLAGQVFLSKEAPQLPLPNCTERDCRCHYVFLDDRRSGIDRRSELEQLEQYPASSEGDRRSSPGRRFDDPLPA